MTKKTLAAANKEDSRIFAREDTSSTFSELCDQYKSSGESVEVDFRTLVGWVRQGDQLTHQLHPYPAKLLPNIAHFFVRAKSLQRRNPLVLDPFCGSGTVALEATIAGHTALVADANPLALLIARVKTTPYDVRTLREAADLLCRRARRYKTAPKVNVVNDHLWYTPEKKRVLEIVSRAVSEVDDEKIRDFFRVCLSVLVRKMSFADPAVSVPVRLRIKEGLSDHHGARISTRLQWLESVDVFSEFEKICFANIERVEEANLTRPDRKVALSVGGDARVLSAIEPQKSGRLRAGSVPLIITSPPYGSAQKYVRASSLSLNWLGFARPDELASLERKSIGREHAPNHSYRDLPDVLPKAYRDLCRKINKQNPIRGRITLEYLHDLRLALLEMMRVTSKDGRIVLVIGNNQVCGETLRNDKFATQILEEAGMRIQLSLIDHIKSRGLMTKRNKTASLISRESVLVFSK
ncbi:hypothetical protein DF133_29810 [Burkholderia cenocepacia]|nr:hypothetical protein DF133_29810 [Burkholderia cenocepacia]